MSETPIDKLEAQLEALVEGAFARLRRGEVSARDLAILLLRAMEDGALESAELGARPTAPDIYRIQLHPENARQFLARSPALSQHLSHFIANLSEESGYRLANRPQIQIVPDHELTLIDAVIRVEFSTVESPSTKPMQALRDAQDQHRAPPQLEIVGGDTCPLDKTVINIGRESDNDIIIADAFVSRYHLQLRGGGGSFTLFDINSRGGTRVNGASVREHRLAGGDVISIGQTALIYRDGQTKDMPYGTTQVILSE